MLRPVVVSFIWLILRRTRFSPYQNAFLGDLRRFH